MNGEVIMRRTLLTFFMMIFFITPIISFATPNMIVVPFLQSIVLAKNSTANVTIVVQNNSTTNLTVTNMVPQIPPNSPVTATITQNHCGFLAPNQNCDAVVQLQGLNQLGSGSLNISVCAFNGALCSRIVQDISVLNAALTAILVFPTNPSIASGTTQQFAAFGLYADGSEQDITNSVIWNSSDKTKATISNASGSQGLATGISAGSSVISAKLDNVSGSSTLTVTPATLTSITVTPVDRTIAKGTALRFFAVGIYSDGTHQNLTSQVLWTSSNTSVATISNSTITKGLALGKGAGSTTITASLGGVSGATTLNVSAATLTEITVTPADPSLAKGERQQFIATGIYTDHTTSDLTNDVTWSTGSALIAIVSNIAGEKGLGLARNVGSTTVTAQLGGVSGSTNLVVTEATLQAIDVAPETGNIVAGETLKYTATGIYSDNSTEDITENVVWRSSNNNIATVSNVGLATGVSVGNVTISAAQQGITGNAALAVDAAALQTITVTPATPNIPEGTEQQFIATGTYSDATTNDLTTQVTWMSSAPTVAIVSNAPGTEGQATAVSAGTTSISASLSGIIGSTNLTVSNAILISLTVAPVNASIPTLTSMRYTATGSYSNATTKDITNEVTWVSSNPLRAVIANVPGIKGLAVGITNGSTTISAFSGAISGATSLNIVSVGIGDSFNGGIVGCLNGGVNNLVVANSNNSTGIVWGGLGTITNALSAVNGAINTNKIVTTLGASISYAAGLCDAYEIDSAGNSPCVGGNTCYNDWFLAATNQTSCTQKNRNQIGGYDRDLYWTSTEYVVAPSISAYYQTYANSGHGPAPGNKADINAVRCVRLINGTT